MSNNETNTSTSTSTADENPTTTSSGSDSASTCGAVPTSCENTPTACDATPVSTCATGEAAPTVCGTNEAAPSVCEGAPEPMSEPSGEARRVQLNPTIDEALSKAIPSLAVEPTAPSATVVPKGDPIEVPRAKDTSLDEQTEAEIAAAMAGVDAAVASAQAVEGTPGAVPPAAAAATKDPKPGSKHKGRVQAVHGDSVIVDIGARSSGILPARLFEETKLPEVGATLDVVVEKIDPEGSLSLALARATVSKPAGNWDQVAVDQIVDCTVTKTNKGGLEVNVSNLRGFMPAGQVDFGFVSNLDGFVGQKLRVKILEVNAQKRNLVVSRRAFLEISRAEQRDEMWKKLEVGQIYKGTVKTVKDYGAFVDIGGVDGLLHVGEMSWTRVNHPKDVVSEGQQVEVRILAIDREKSKVSLGMKQLQANPWQAVTERFAPSSITRGKVAKVTDFGAFVELEPGLEGLIHISELEHRRVNRVTDVVNVGQEIDVQVLSIDLEKRRIALSRKALLTKPESARSPEEDLPSAAAYERKRKGPLKGGGTGSGGFTFGRPDEY